MDERITYVGLDVHKKTISVAMLVPGARKPLEWKQNADTRAVKRLIRRLKKEANESPLLTCYEAGPFGYALQRKLKSEGIECEVIAPSLIPSRPGERIKTDRRDARKLVEFLRAGLLTEVTAPTEEDEALRALSRCRAQTKKDVMRHRHRLNKFLLCRGIVYRSGSRWTKRHRVWLRSVELEQPLDQVVFEEYQLAMEQAEARLESIHAKLEEAAKTESCAQAVGWLRTFRGIDTITAMTVVTEIHSFARFQSPDELMAYLGLVPSEHTSGDSTQRGRITKAGNSYVRRILVEIAWHYRHQPSIGVKLRKRREGQPAWVIAIADKAQRRLNRRYKHLVYGRAKPPQVAIVAVARELAGFIWAVLRPREAPLQALTT